MTISDAALNKVIDGVLASGDAAVEGVMAICARLAMKGVFDRKDIEVVLAKMLKSLPRDDVRVTSTIEQQRTKLLELAERNITDPPPSQHP